VRTTRKALAGLALVALVAGGCGDGDEEGETSAGGGSPDAGGTIEIVAGDDSFSPASVEVEPGQTVTVDVRSDSSRAHTFTVVDQGISEALAPEGSVTVEVTMPDDGVVAFFCEIHGDAGMRGELSTPGAAAPGSGDEPTTTVPAVGYGY
jgi:plastocyanin